MDSQDTKNSCTACSCPCERHKEHNHPLEGEQKKGARACQMCGCGHKTDESCHCSCK